MWRVGWALLFVSGCFAPVPEPGPRPDAGAPPCARSLGVLDVTLSDQPPVSYVLSAYWRSHRRRVSTGGLCLDFELFDCATLGTPALRRLGDGPADSLTHDPTFVPGQKLIALEGRLERAIPVTSSTFPPRFQVNWEVIDPTSRTVQRAPWSGIDDSLDVFPAAALARDGGARVVLANAQNGSVSLEYLGEEALDGGQVWRELVGLEDRVGVDLLEVSDGLVGHQQRSLSTPRFGIDLTDATFFRTSGSGLEIVALDAGACVLDRRARTSAEVGAWCESKDRTEILHFARLFERRAPTRWLADAGEVQVIGEVEGQLLVGVHVRNPLNDERWADVAWLDEEGLRVVVESRPFPVGYGAWDAGTAALTFYVPDAGGSLELIEARSGCR